MAQQVDALRIAARLALPFDVQRRAREHLGRPHAQVQGLLDELEQAPAPAERLGQRLARELFGEASPLGEFVRVAGARFRVIGLMEPKGTMLGIDIDDVVYVPVASAMTMFNLPELLEIDVLYAHGGLAKPVEAAVRATLTRRHGDE